MPSGRLWAGRGMPRRRSQAENEEPIDVAVTIRKNAQVSDFLKNKHYDLLVKNGEKLDCPVCLESVLGCRNCFCLLICGHAMHLHEYLKLTKCPVCRE